MPLIIGFHIGKKSKSRNFNFNFLKFILFAQFRATNEENFVIKSLKIQKCFINFNSSSECGSLLANHIGTKSVYYGNKNIYPERNYYFKFYLGIFYDFKV